MALSQRKNRIAFRPMLEEGKLEDRVVLSTTSSAHVAAFVSSAQASDQLVTRQQALEVRVLYNQQLRSAFDDLRSYADNQIVSAYNDAGLQPWQRLPSQQLSDLLASISGAIDATAFRLASQTDLLPGSTGLSTRIQANLLGSNRASLLSQVQSLGPRLTETQLIHTIDRQIMSSYRRSSANLLMYFRTVNFDRLLANQSSQGGQTGQVNAAALVTPQQVITTPSPLQQFMIQRAINQFDNGFGALTTALPNFAQTTLFNGNPTNPITTDTTAFNTGVNNALTGLNFQLGSALAAIPGVTSNPTFLPQLQQGVFGTTGLSSGINTLIAGQPSFDVFQNSLTPVVDTGFTSVSTPLFGLFNNPNITVPTTNPITSGFSSPLGPLFTGNTFANGFNSGFGSGFVGLGTTTPTTFNPNFGTGFFNTANTFNTGLGLTQPTVIV